MLFCEMGWLAICWQVGETIVSLCGVVLLYPYSLHAGIYFVRISYHH